MKLNVLRPSGWCRRLGWFAVAAAMALCTLPVLGDTIPALPVTLVANPLPAGQDQTTLTWNAPTSTAVEVHVGSPTGTLFADGGPTGSAATGAWATLGMSFYLVDATTHQSLASASVQQPGATLTASPNPLPDGVNQTTLTWNAPNSLGVEIHVGSADRPLFAEGGNSRLGGHRTLGQTPICRSTWWTLRRRSRLPRRPYRTLMQRPQAHSRRKTRLSI